MNFINFAVMACFQSATGSSLAGVRVCTGRAVGVCGEEFTNISIVYTLPDLESNVYAPYRSLIGNSLSDVWVSTGHDNCTCRTNYMGR